MAIDILGGYRIVRKLGEGARAEVFLGAAADAAAPDPVAIKVYRPEAPATAPLAEAEALTRAAGDQVVALLDAAPAAHGTIALVLSRLPGGSLGRLLRDRTNIGVGEAITILAPLASALARAHRSGVVHGGVRLEAVLFDAGGAPALACFGNSSLIEPDLPAALLEAEPGVVDDVHAMAGLAATVLERAGIVMGFEIDSAATWLETFELKLFDLADPQPVIFEADGMAPPSVPARMVGGEPVPIPAEVRALLLPEWIERMLPRDAEATVRAVVTRVRGALAMVRPRVWVPAAGVAAALVVALMLAAPGGRDAEATPAEVPIAMPSPAPAPGPVSGDDPVLAVPQLLAARERCIRDRSVLCLDDVDQQGSAAIATDAALIRSLQAGAETPAALGSTAPVLVERLGDSAIVALGAETEPASVLLMKGEAGWRIRDYLAD